MLFVAGHFTLLRLHEPKLLVAARSSPATHWTVFGALIKLPYLRQSVLTVLDSGLYAVDYGFQIYWIPEPWIANVA